MKKISADTISNVLVHYLKGEEFLLELASIRTIGEASKRNVFIKTPVSKIQCNGSLYGRHPILPWLIFTVPDLFKRKNNLDEFGYTKKDLNQLKVPLYILCSLKYKDVLLYELRFSTKYPDRTFFLDREYRVNFHSMSDEIRDFIEKIISNSKKR